MNDSPCLVCGTPCTDDDMCERWQDWFASRWERARLSLGVDPPAAKGRPPRHLYEVRDAMDGTLICRGKASTCAAVIGCSVETVRRGAQTGYALKKRLRITRLETGGEVDDSDGMED